MATATALAWMSAGVAAVGYIQQGRATDKAAKFNAQVADQNAQISRDQSAADAVRMRRMARKQRGAARAAIGASGVALEGSALDILEQSAFEAELDVQNRLYQGELQATGFKNTATLERFGGRAARQKGLFNAGSTLLLTGSNVKRF